MSVKAPKNGKSIKSGFQIGVYVNSSARRFSCDGSGERFRGPQGSVPRVRVFLRRREKNKLAHSSKLDVQVQRDLVLPSSDYAAKSCILSYARDPPIC